MKMMKLTGLMGLLLVACSVQAQVKSTTLNFTALNNASGTNSTLMVGGSTNDLSIVRSADGNDYSVAVGSCHLLKI